MDVISHLFDQFFHSPSPHFRLWGSVRSCPSMQLLVLPVWPCWFHPHTNCSSSELISSSQVASFFLSHHIIMKTCASILQLVRGQWVRLWSAFWFDYQRCVLLESSLQWLCQNSHYLCQALNTEMPWRNRFPPVQKHAGSVTFNMFGVSYIII